MARVFGIARSRLALRESFVIRYSPQTQPSLGIHRDGTLLSCNVLLNGERGAAAAPPRAPRPPARSPTCSACRCLVP
eukprot:2541530-Prymnesium_polylepis.1